MTGREYKKLRNADLPRRGRLLKTIANRGGQLVGIGSEVSIVEKRSGLTIEVPVCPACGQSSYIRKIDPGDVELLS